MKVKKTSVRLFLSFLFVLVLVLCISNRAFAEPPKNGCVSNNGKSHDWEQLDYSEPTCTKDGYTKYQCQRCTLIHTDKIKTSGHEWYTDIITEATCTKDGKAEKYCLICGDTETVTISAKGHTWNNGIVIKAATCTENGTMEYTCKVCGQKNTTTVNAKGHSWDNGKVTKDATCTKEGSKEYTCRTCKKTRKEIIPAKGHTPVKLSGKSATCTESGLTDGIVCSVCKLVLESQKVINPSGHKWDKGRITRNPVRWKPGVRTFTCSNDHKHTKTESVDPGPWIFAYVHGNSSPKVRSNPLVITSEPKDTYIKKGSETRPILKVEASGGTKPYTFKWYRKGNTKAYQDGLSVIKWLADLFGKDYSEIEKTLNESFYEGQSCVADLIGYDYWCEVTDSAGNSITSKIVKVSEAVSVGTQPKNEYINSNKKTGTLECQAVGGSGQYNYAWKIYDTAKKEYVTVSGGKSTGNTTVDKAGKYICKITDKISGHIVESDPCMVVEAEPLTVKSSNAHVYKYRDEITTIYAQFSGGTAPYEIDWEFERKSVPFVPLDSNMKTYTSAKDAGYYTCTCKDANGFEVSVTVEVDNLRMEITKQPEGGELPVNGKVVVSVTVKDGKAPYKYYLYTNGKASQVSETGKFDVWFPCKCSILTIDSQGYSVMSDTVEVTKPGFRIKEQTEKASITSSGGSVSLYVTAERGNEPYKYEWSYGEWSYKEGRYIWYKHGSNSNQTSAYKPGKYRCLVVDSKGYSIWSKEIEVAYKSTKPLILKYPKDRMVTLNWDGKADFTLTCKAICQEGDGNPLYEWYWRPWEAGIGQDFKLVGSSINEFYDDDTPGMYKCRVVNLKTRDYVWSNTVTVYEKLEFVDLKMVDDYEDREIVEALVYFRGGCGPYVLNCYRVKNYKQSDETLMGVGGKEIYFQKDISPVFVTKLKRYRRYTVQEGKYTIAKYEPQAYIVELKDQFGQVARSTVIIGKGKNK